MGSIGKPYYTIKEELRNKTKLKNRKISVFLLILLFGSWYRIILADKTLADIQSLFFAFLILVSFRFFSDLRYANLVALDIRKGFKTVGFSVKKSDIEKLESLSDIFMLSQFYFIGTFFVMVVSLVLINPENIIHNFPMYFASYIENIYIHGVFGYFVFAEFFIRTEETISNFSYTMHEKIRKHLKII